MPRFEGAQIVITGVGHEGQVGEAICKAFAREGAVLSLLEWESGMPSASGRLRSRAPAATPQPIPAT